MTGLKHFAFALALVCLTFAVTAQAQTPSIEVTTDADAAQFSTRGRAQAIHAEVFAPSGELVFEGDGLDGQAVEWQMRNQKGERVADGVYLATITVTDTSGNRRKRIEQISVSSDTAASAPSPQPEPLTAPSGSGTAGKIAKWTGTSALGNSIMTENTSRIGINTAQPTARLHVFSSTPAPVAKDGTAAIPLLLTAGGKGGKTTVAGKKGGAGANIVLAAGGGGDAVAGSSNGPGGNIILQPGQSGAGGFGDNSGNVFMALNGGRVGVATNDPLARLHAEGGDITGLFGKSDSTIGVYGRSDKSKGVYGYSETGTGVFGYSSSGYAGYFSGKLYATQLIEAAGGLKVTGGCTGCNPPSDRALKTNFAAVNPRFILDRLAQLQIQTWSYKSEPAGVRHIGAMAQDFRAAFQFGTDDKTLSVVDAHGVTMAAIQGLYQQNLELLRTVERQSKQLEQVQARLARVERTMRKKRTASRR